MLEPSDETLLKSFATHRDEEAFRALANRYLGLIFHTALRRSGNRQIAEEVSQNILCALAKKAASLSRHPERLAAWLHRATLFESSKAMRSESSYHRRKSLSHPDETAATRPPEPERWTEAVPHLDTALDQLSDGDRQVLLLHYFEKLTYPRIASRLGKSPEAVKKQTQRATHKLARILRARGVPLSLAALATGLTSEFAKGAPLTLIQSAAAAALASHATHSTTALTVMFASKTKTALALAILLCAIPIGLQQLAISNAAERNESLRSQLASAGKPRAATADRFPIGSTRIHGLSTSTDIMVLVDEYDEARRSEGPGISSHNQRIMRFRQKLAALDTDTLVRLIQECAELRIQFTKKSQAFHELIDQLGLRDPGLAARAGTSAIETEPRLRPAITKIGKFLHAWAITDPEGSWEWLKRQQEKPAFDQSLQSSERVIDWLTAPFAASMIAIQAPLLNEMFDGMTETDRAGLFNLLVSRNFTDGMPNIAAEAVWALDCIKAINGFAPETDRAKLLESLITGPNCDQLLTDTQASRTFLMEADIDRDEMQALLRAITSTLLRNTRPNSDVDTMQGDLREWLEALSPGAGSAIMDDVLTQNAQKSVEFLQRNQSQPDDTLIRHLTSPTASFKRNLPAALTLAARIEDPAKRAAVIEHLNKE